MNTFCIVTRFIITFVSRLYWNKTKLFNVSDIRNLPDFKSIMFGFNSSNFQRNDEFECIWYLIENKYFSPASIKVKTNIDIAETINYAKYFLFRTIKTTQKTTNNNNKSVCPEVFACYCECISFSCYIKLFGITNHRNNEP